MQAKQKKEQAELERIREVYREEDATP